MFRGNEVVVALLSPLKSTFKSLILIIVLSFKYSARGVPERDVKSTLILPSVDTSPAFSTLTLVLSETSLEFNLPDMDISLKYKFANNSTAFPT
jgi:hypothetical protein